MSNDRLILCGDTEPPMGAASKVVQLNLWGHKHNVDLKLEDITERMAANVPDLLTDLLEVATYVYCADQATTRGGNEARNMGVNWRRHFHFVVPVREPERWSAVSAPLGDALSFLSEDKYHFDFVKLSQPPPVQQYLDFGGDLNSFSPDVVMLFSGGLDSLAGAVEELIGNGKRVALVSHRSAPKMSPRLRDLVRDLQKKCGDTQQILHVPVWVRKSQKLKGQPMG